MPNINSPDTLQNYLNNNPGSQPSWQQQPGISAPAVPTADGNGLPYSKVPDNRSGQVKRNIISWFIPQFGLIKMYINPQSISYRNKKVIEKTRTKGGYSLQYWGEDLTEITLAGVTGSSGIEGINVLYEIYRAEQYAFDSVALSMQANNAATDLASKAVNMLTGNSPIGNLAGGLINGLLGQDTPNNSLAIKNVISLASLAFTVEMYYNGWVYRGYFEEMTFGEKANDFLIDYSIKFTATQRRGYRTNYFPWARSASQGPSVYNTPRSYDLNNIQNTNTTVLNNTATIAQK